MTPGHVVGRVERAEGVIVAVGRSSASVPALVLETVSDEHDVTVHEPVFDDSSVTGFDSAGTIDELQRDGSAWDESYPATNTFNDWVAEDRLPV